MTIKKWERLKLNENINAVEEAVLQASDGILNVIDVADTSHIPAVSSRRHGVACSNLLLFHSPLFSYQKHHLASIGSFAAPPLHGSNVVILTVVITSR